MDRYTLVAPLGEGGQATVWKAIDPLEGGAVRALKVFQLGRADSEASERARREAKAIVGSRHPGLLPCRSLFEDPAADLLGLVFDYVRGRSLADALSDPRMTAAHRRWAVRQLADTLAHVHALRVVHRDIKPDNVLVTDAFWQAPGEPGTLKLVDFGISAPAGNPKPLTREGGVVGTTPYLPPELADREGSFEAGDDLRRDVFAFGVLAWEVLIGGHPTGLPLGASRDAFAGAYLAARAGNRTWPPEAPPSAELPLVQACLSLSPRGRPISCVAVAEGLHTGVIEDRAPRTSVPVAIDARSSLGSETELHFAPRTAATLEFGGASSPPAPPRSGSPRVAHLPQTRGIPAAPRSPPRSPPRAGTPWGLLFGAVVMTAAMVSTAAYFATREPTSDLPPPFSVGTGPGGAVTLVPGETPAVAAAPERAVVVCCNSGSTTCTSGRECQPAPCEQYIGSGPWRLRVTGGVLPFGKTRVQIKTQWPLSLICLKNTRTGDRECASSSAMLRDGSDRANRVLATTRDLVEGNFEVEVLDRGVSLSHEHGYGSPKSYKTTALCTNTTLRLRDYDKDVGQISIFLDDP